MFIGSRIKNLRIEKGLSQEELGKIIGVSKVSICGYEKGTKNPNIEKLEKLVDTLDVSFDYVFGHDKSIVSDSSEEYHVKMSNEDIEIIKEIKLHSELYKKMIENPKRMIELIDRKINK